MSDWKTIDTAPRDGTKVVVAAYAEGEARWQFRVDYWRKYKMDFGEGWGWFGVSPTHWTHLPPAPPATT